MALREEFESTGNWLFRWRSYLPFCLLGLLILAIPDMHRPSGSAVLQYRWEWLCFAISFLGLALRFVVGGHVAPKTSGRNTLGQVAESINTTGIYSIVRHPLYLGNYLMWLGIAMFCFVPWVAAVFTLCFWLYYERIMFAEEEFLRRKFGDQYVKWAERTPAFVPRFSHWAPPALPFSLKTAIRKEYTGLFGLAVGFAAMDQFENFVVTHRYSVEPVWIVFLGLSLILYCTFMVLKKRTSLLRVPGR